ncbi:LysR family glycine cleavage system transcriptional activator [Loktanella ponticola]|uniref:LysR family glycine cleavage system transcriptional activator n=1 Tax=Yoonia ponticola TaxID=1524255 RepID=A0A7W9BN33_9RHOB|nr:LysR family transcriptional regulator [Yoonia ponticola]MBB5723582.1 LysR family glycine cleavage system transcriptional activator [Yoonia ponticola]|tara:strand:- start:40664 stop:41566 length:903 start_codon:yes stop_codon:yes gene_type:complete
MQSILPHLRALHAFESFGRLGSVSAAARELGVTPGAISQQIKILEEQLQMQLIMKDGRRASLAPRAKAYHAVLSSGFEKLKQAQHLLSQQVADLDVHVSGLPTLLLKWLNPRLHRFEARFGETSIRLEATHVEPDPEFLDHMFRLTYGTVSNVFPHARALFRDTCFPVCSPGFLKDHPDALDLEKMANLPWIDIDWGPAYASVPRLSNWLVAQGMPKPAHRPISVHSLSSSALEAVASGKGIALAQSSFASIDIDLGRLVRMSQKFVEMPEPYFICWGPQMMENEKSRNFLNWVLSEASG